MKLRVRFTEDPAGARWFGLCFEHDGACYPHAEHHDFGVDVLGQWTVAMRELLRGAERVELPFLEGGHACVVSRVTDDACLVAPQGVEPPVVWPTTVRELATLICETAAHVAATLPEAGELPRDVESLRELLVP